MYEEARQEEAAKRKKVIADVWAKKGERYKKKLAELDKERQSFTDKMELFD
eukprot:CAMPEP_0185598658 /NCGR_PEP_ID=MMETSP0434-20130131/82156_1 /TAXON_ID=626734 ORGANISM="Favella taraikaensis, Strain Fe Narragansett Bay" /NCGR_SAMPLE_ID=MMETSP0434 /ASSEMBLY_ACC=CAM_ASM_000379 /LENGTH=50 /DNA_ID=CAMNT_0028227741 /DNA_START=788 /DNA_END=940 /DNA_ORIENTATION=-